MFHHSQGISKEGLGLHISQKLVKIMNGTVQYLREAERSSFIILVELHCPASASASVLIIYLLPWIKMETKPTDEMINPGHDDISVLLDLIPATTMPPTPGEPGWYNSPSGKMSNGPSSVVTDTDDIGLEMQQLASSLSIAPMDAATDWNTGSCTWNNMPGIC